MMVRKLRLQHNWSQEQLSQFSGLSNRTIQRIERGENASIESLKSLAAVFEVEVSELQQEQKNMEPELEKVASGHTTATEPTSEELSVEGKGNLAYIDNIKFFYLHLGIYIVVMIFLVILNVILTPGHYWAIWPALPWGLSVVGHGLWAFEVLFFLGSDWEKKQLEKRKRRKP
ncbi:MAG: helix-turn-helix domain-containing protein [Alteromonadaceae bacterium]|nr:helix-turn-helix domain-containing protein [Alteromonadaceae bacterium]